MFEALRLRREEVEARNENLRSRVRVLPPERRREYYRLHRGKIKDPDTYAALNWSLILGLHHFYLGAWLRGTINLILMLVGIATFPIGGFLLLIAVGLVELGALFRSQVVVEAHNVTLGEELVNELENGPRRSG